MGVEGKGSEWEPSSLGSDHTCMSEGKSFSLCLRFGTPPLRMPGWSMYVTLGWMVWSEPLHSWEGATEQNLSPSRALAGGMFCDAQGGRGGAQPLIHLIRPHSGASIKALRGFPSRRQ